MQLAALCQELADGAEILRHLVRGISPAEARARPAPDAWSMLEVVCHLYDEEREDFRPRLDVILHRPAERWPPIDPAGWVTARRYNDRDLGQVVDQFMAERARSLAWLQGLSACDWEAEYRAPFGVIKAGDMLAAWVAHDVFHMRQLVKLRRARVTNLVAPYDPQYAGDW